MTEPPKNIAATLSGHAQSVINKLPKVVKVDGHTFKVRQISNAVRSKIDRLNQTAYFYEQQLKDEITLKQAHKITRILDSLHAKTAAYYLIGNWAFFVPFYYWFKWHQLNLYGAKVLSAINEAGQSNSDTDFFLANWQLTKVQLALSMRPIGEGVKQYQERMESAESMLDEDASPKKKADK